MNKIKEMDPLRSENWAGLYADVPDEVVAGVHMAHARIRRYELRRKRMISALSLAACAVLAVGACGLALNSKRPVQSPDRVAEPVAEVILLHAADSVYSSNDDPCFHVYADCSRAKAGAVELPLVTAQEFEKQLCEICGANVSLEA